jgi:adenylylsulfate kinase-like enzyme
MEKERENIHRHTGDVAPEERAAIKGQQPIVIWLTATW